MDIKNILMFSFGSLLFSIIVITGFLFFLQPDKQVGSEGTKAIKELQNQTSETTTISAKQEFSTSRDSLKSQISALQIGLENQQVIIDSLNGLVSEKITLAENYQKDIENLQQSIVDMQQVGDQAKSLAKTFETMKTNEIGRSVADLDDTALMQIYNSMNGRHRKNLLMAVSAERAARLTKKMMTLASE